MFLTKREHKKLRRVNRREAWKEKQDKIRSGSIFISTIPILTTIILTFIILTSIILTSIILTSIILTSIILTTVGNIVPIADGLGRPDQSARPISDW